MLARTIRKARGGSGAASLAATCMLSLCAGGAYAARVVSHSARPSHTSVPAPRIGAKPAAKTAQTSARFTFSDRQRKVTFECSLDGARFSKCSSPATYGVARVTVKTRCTTQRTSSKHHTVKRCKRVATKSASRPLARRKHTFRVRATAKRRKPGRPASYTWMILGQLPPAQAPATPAPPIPSGAGATPAGTPENFDISGQPSGMLYPGAPPQMLPLTLSNPNPMRLVVTALTVSAAGPPGCASAQNLEITQSDVSAASPVILPADGSVSLPAQGVAEPSVQLLDLASVDQDGCRGAVFALTYSGSAHS
jgi:hypothetical protein